MFDKALSTRMTILFLLLLSALGKTTIVAGQEEIAFIGQIQGRGQVSPYVGRKVRFRGIVSGVLEDRNLAGIRYYTLFVQNLPEESDGDKSTSDGIAVFSGRSHPGVTIGDLVVVSGSVTEFYGLTEVDDRGLEISIVSRNNLLPEPVELNPPMDNQASDDYLEQYEGMHVKLPLSQVVGPTHPGCGFAVVRADIKHRRIISSRREDPTGAIIEILNTSDVECKDFPSVGFGDRLSGLKGPLVYHFDLFKIVQQSFADVEVYYGERLAATKISAPSGSISLVTFNFENYFDSVSDTGLEAEPVPSPMDVASKRRKLVYAIGRHLDCPTVLGVQEVENEGLLITLADELQPICGFTYDVTHRDTPDVRGSDVAMLSDPRSVEITKVTTHQGCSSVVTEVRDPTVSCAAGEAPLFSRPPLQVDTMIEGQEYTFLINHFKSKRGGETETEPQRVAQAYYLANLVQKILGEDPAKLLVLLGDFNDFERSSVMKILEGDRLLIHILESIPSEERYTYIFSGASQLLDWILLSPPLAVHVLNADIVHVNADFPYTIGKDTSQDGLPFHSSDHDIPVVTLHISSVGEGSKLSMSADEVVSEGERSADMSYLVMVLLTLAILGIVITAGIVVSRVKHQSS